MMITVTNQNIPRKIQTEELRKTYQTVLFSSLRDTRTEIVSISRKQVHTFRTPIKYHDTVWSQFNILRAEEFMSEARFEL